MNPLHANPPGPSLGPDHWEPVPVTDRLGRIRGYRIAREGQSDLFVKPLAARGAQPTHQNMWAEPAALDLLGSVGAPVPELVAVDAPNGLMAIAWVDGDPVDDWLQTARDAATMRKAATQVVQAWWRLESSFAAVWPELHPWAHPDRGGLSLDATVKNRLEATLRNETGKWVEVAWQAGVTARARGIHRPGWKTQLQTAWKPVLQSTLAGPLSPGSLDCNGRNCLVSPQRTTFLDFSSLGWDWPERRLTLYSASLRGRLGTGRFAALLHDLDLSELEISDQEALDSPTILRISAWHMVCWGQVCAQALAALQHPHTPQGAAIERTWPDLPQAFPTLLHAWAHPPRAPESAPVAALLREGFDLT